MLSSKILSGTVAAGVALPWPLPRPLPTRENLARIFSYLLGVAFFSVVVSVGVEGAAAAVAAAADAAIAAGGNWQKAKLNAKAAEQNLPAATLELL